MKETLLFVRSNSQTEHLSELDVEFAKLQEILGLRGKKEDYLLVMSPVTAHGQLTDMIGMYKEDLLLFHFSGHAGLDRVQLHDEAARSQGLAQLLGQCPNLKMVFLNGCSTYGMVRELQEHIANPNLVIVSSSAPVGDSVARNFSVALYRELERGSPVGTAFNLALGDSTLRKDIGQVTRGIFQEEGPANTPLWGIHHKTESPPEFVLPRSRAKVDLGSDMAAVSCDRKKVLREFEQDFDEADQKGCRVVSFLLLEKPYGQSESLVKRLMLTLSDLRPGEVKPQGFDDIAVETVDLDGIASIEDSQGSFRRAVIRKMGMPPRMGSLKEFAAQIQSGTTKLSGAIRYIPHAFLIRFDAPAWASLAEPLLHWATGEFLYLPANGAQDRVFVFFFILEPLQKEENPGQGFLSKFFGKSKSAKNPSEDLHAALRKSFPSAKPPLTPVTVLPELTKVDKNDLDDWYRQFESNQVLRKELVGKLIEKLPKSEEAKWDMSHIELELKQIVEAYRNKKRGI